VVHLADQLVLKHVLPEGDIVHEVIMGVEPIRADPGEGVARHSCVGTCREKTSEKDQGKRKSEPRDAGKMNVVQDQLLKVSGKGFLRSPEQVH
jgi:hypothetical protein